MQRDKLKQYDINPIFLSQMETIQYVSSPLLSLGSSTTRLNPNLSTSPIARKTNLVGQTKLIVLRDLQRYQIRHIRIQRRFKYCSQINFIINPQLFRSRQTHRKRRLHRIDLQEHRGDYGIENKRERTSNLATGMDPQVYGKLLTLHRRGNGVDV